MRFAGRRVALSLFALAILAGAVAAWLVQREVSAVAAASGAPTAVLVAAAPIESGRRIDADTVGEVATIVEIPAKFAPPDALSDAADVAGLRAETSIPLGGYLTRSAFSRGTGGGGYELRRGERAISIDVSPAPDGAEPVPGSVVDLVASGIGGAPESRVLIAGAEVLAASTTADSTARLTVRVAAAQVPTVVRADVFAREVRAVIR